MNQEKNTPFFEKFFNSLTTKNAILLIFIIGFIVFFNSLFNGFVIDDILQITGNPSIHSITNVGNIFLNKMGIQGSSGYYRPLSYIFYTFIYSFFGNNAFFYHFIQLLLHIINSVLVFLFFKKFLRKELAFFLSLIFLVHPINQETVAYASNLEDTLYFFFGLNTLMLLDRTSGKVKNIFVASMFLLLAILSKEIGILFFLFTILYVLLFKKNKMILYITFSTFVLITYAFLRLISQTPIQKTALIPIMSLSIWGRLANVPMIILYYLKTLLFPWNLTAVNTWAITSFKLGTFFVPLFWDAIFLVCLLLLCIYVYKKDKKSRKLLIFFSIWFLVSLGSYLQIIPLDSTVSNHFFYTPFVGLLAILGLFLQNIRLSKTQIMILLSVGVFILISLSGRTIIRNSDWKDQYTLLSHDEKISRDDYVQELLYSVELIKINKYEEAYAHINKAIILYPQSSEAWTILGAVYYGQRKIDKAKEAYLKAISTGGYYGAYSNLSLLLLQYDTPVHAREFILKAVKVYPGIDKLWYFLILAEYKSGNHDGALVAAKNYYLLRGDSQSYGIYSSLLNNIPLNIILK